MNTPIMKETRAKSSSRETLWAFIDRKAAHKSLIGCRMTGDNYIRFKNCLSRYCGGKKPALYLDDIDAKFVTDFESHLRSQGLNQSTISYYNRIFRSLYNQAAADGLIKNTHPFDGAYTKVTAVRRFDKVLTPEGTVLLDTLPKDEILRRYRQLAVKYDTLVGKIAKLAGV